MQARSSIRFSTSTQNKRLDEVAEKQPAKQRSAMAANLASSQWSIQQQPFIILHATPLKSSHLSSMHTNLNAQSKDAIITQGCLPFTLTG